MYFFRFFLLCISITLWAADAAVDLLEPALIGDDATIHVTTRNYYPDQGERLIFQLSEDQLFSTVVVTHEQREGPRTYRNLEPGDYYVRAFIRNLVGEMKSDFSNVIWFRIPTQDIPRPTIVLSGDQPVAGDTLDVFWTPVAAANLISWQLQVCDTPDFPNDITDNLFPASNEVRSSVPIDHLIGRGTLFLRIRARYPLSNSPWSNLLIVTYDRPDIHLYSLPHVPDAAGWDTWLQIHMPVETAATIDGPAVEVTYLRPSLIGDPDLTRLDLVDLEPGGTVRLPLSADIDRAPVLVRATVPLSIGLHYDNVLGGDMGVVQIQRHRPDRAKTLIGLVERRTGSPFYKTFSALVLANQSDRTARNTVRLEVIDADRNRTILEREVLIFVDRWANEVYFLSQLLPELIDLETRGEVFTYSINVLARREDEGLDLLGATFNTIDGLLFPSYFQGVPY